MKTLLIGLTLFLALLSITVNAEENPSGQPTKKTIAPSAQVIAYYFHGTSAVRDVPED